MSTSLPLSWYILMHQNYVVKDDCHLVLPSLLVSGHLLSRQHVYERGLSKQATLFHAVIP